MTEEGTLVEEKVSLIARRRPSGHVHRWVSRRRLLNTSLVIFIYTSVCEEEESDRRLTETFPDDCTRCLKCFAGVNVGVS